MIHRGPGLQPMKTMPKSDREAEGGRAVVELRVWDITLPNARRAVTEQNRDAR